jgi:hypothetical protein
MSRVEFETKIPVFQLAKTLKNISVTMSELGFIVD